MSGNPIQAGSIDDMLLVNVAAELNMLRVPHGEDSTTPKYELRSNNGTLEVAVPNGKVIATISYRSRQGIVSGTVTPLFEAFLIDLTQVLAAHGRELATPKLSLGHGINTSEAYAGLNLGHGYQPTI